MATEIGSIVITPPHKPSYLHNPGIEPISALTVGQLVDIAADKWPDKEAIVSVFQGHRYTFAEVREKTDNLAAGLTQLGLKPGDRLGIWGPNSTQWYITRLAADRGGFIAVHIDPMYQPPQLLHALTKVGVKLLVCPGDSFYERLRVIVPELDNYPESGAELSSAKVPSLKSLVVISDKQYRGAYRYDDVLASALPATVKKIRELQTLIDPDEGSCILFSSGTTGQPKGALMSHRGLVNGVFFPGQWFLPDTLDGALVLPVLFCHTSGLMAGIMGTVRFGATLILPSATFDIKKTLEAIIKFGAAMTLGTPSLFVDMITIARQEGLKVTTLKTVAYGGAPCPVQVALEMKEVLNIKRILPIFGMTETGLTFVGKPEDTLEQMTSTSGCLCYHTEAKVVDVNGRMVPMGTQGELWVRGYSVMNEYWGDEEMTRQLITKDGWVKTGDLFILQEDGYGKVVGRINEVIIRIGDKIFPTELEEFFQEHPDVQETQVFGVPDSRTGEEICAYFRLKDGTTLTQQDIVDYCKGKIPDYQIPRYIRFANTFPRSPMGKVVKSYLLQTLLKEIEGK
ncbi:acyl-CoA synthetase family member 2, mitochondrial-like [Zootermopsis nevadensis]|uniref:acyl-CoA synthetase family member 2, mitochondrial-like n=1 Tax=Zootermopsis nevadensis TaxID=136037 RepID=UPI000B8E5C46|nr:acyl-CoA synthetase family member 2, mitochondrial-like [Zootermopsis nevadensis]